MKTMLEVLVENYHRNNRKIKAIQNGTYNKEFDAWFIINESVRGQIPDKLYNQALELRKEQQELELKCKEDAFNFNEGVKQLNNKYGVEFVKYDRSVGFCDNCRKGFTPFSGKEDDYGFLYIQPWNEDEIGDDAIRRYCTSPELASILLRLNQLYEKAINYLFQLPDPKSTISTA